jgi:hypothetical protein
LPAACGRVRWIALAMGHALQTEVQRKLQAMNLTGGQPVVPDPA